MKRTLLLLSLLVLGLGLWERRLSHGVERRRIPAGIGRLLSAEVRAGLRVAAVRIEDAGGTHLFERRGLWRCVSYHGAVLDQGRLRDLVLGLSDAQGVVASDVPAHAARHGIATRDTLRVSLLGPGYAGDPAGLDLRLAIDVGHAVPERGTTFVRVRGSREVWEVDGDLRALLQPAAPALPPLVDARLVPAAWPGWEGGVRAVAIVPRDGPKLDLVQRALRRSEAELRGGLLPWSFELLYGDTRFEVDPERAQAFLGFLRTVTLLSLTDPDVDVLPQQAFETPLAELTLNPHEAQPCTLLFAEHAGRLYVQNTWTATLCLLPPESRRGLLPTPDDFRPENPGPWSSATVGGH